MSRTRLLALGVSIIATVTGLVALSAASAATALAPCPEPAVATAAAMRSCPPPPPPTTRRTTPPSTTPPPPPAHLQATYIGSVASDANAPAQVVMRFSGDDGPVYADVTIADGVRFDCHGNQNVGMLRFSMSGSRHGPSVELHRDVATEYSGESVDLSFSTSATLSPDGLALSGPVHLHVGLPWYLSDCDLDWSFQTRSMTPAPAPPLVAAPDIVGLRLASALAALHGAGLVPGNRHDVVQPDCGEGVGTVLAQNPGAGTPLPPGAAVDYTVGVMPSGNRRCQ